MAVTQTVTLTKAGAGYTSIEEARDAVHEVLGNETYLEWVRTKEAAGAVNETVTFDEPSQTLSVTRVWNDDAYAAFINDTADMRTANRAALEGAGWTFGGSPSI